jgi:hypothetical protein
MITTNRAFGISLTGLMVVAVASALALLPGCSSDKPAKEPAAQPAAVKVAPKPASLAQIKSELLESKAQIQLTTDALNKLQKSSPADAQANYNAFSEQFVKLQAKAEQNKARADDLKAKSEAYYAAWNRQVEVDNPDLRRQAIQQKVQAEQTFNTIKSEMQLARIAYDPYVANLKDVGNYLRGNVTPANLNSISDLVTKANGQAKEVNTHIDAIVTAVDKISTATGEGAAVGTPAPTDAAAPAAAPGAAR